MSTALDTSMPPNRTNFIPDTTNLIPTPTTSNNVVSFPPTTISSGIIPQQQQPQQQQQQQQQQPQQLPLPVSMAMSMVKPQSTLIPASTLPNNGVIHNVPLTNSTNNNNKNGNNSNNPVTMTLNAVSLPANVTGTGAALTPATNAVPVPQAPAPAPPTKSKSSKKSKSKSGNGNSLSMTQGENTGRWTAEEHRLFLEGLEKHGKGWKKIASLIKSRTVVQIRTHAQKYFQKLAKARQNGEEGDVSMEGRGGAGVSALTQGMAVPPPQQKARRVSVSDGSVGDNKRKALGTVVASARREAKRRNPNDPSPPVAPGLAPYVMQNGYNQIPQLSNNTNTNNDQSNNPGAALEESLFRFLTPSTREFGSSMTTTHDLNNVPNAPTNEIPSCNGNDVSNSSSNNNPNHFIVLPNINNNNNKNNEGSELSPTCVADVSAGSFPLASNRLLEPETPGWYARGADVDELLNEAYALDWLADSGDLDEDYSPAPEISPRAPHSATDALPPVVSGAPAPNGTDALPGLFDVASGNNNSGGSGSGSSNANGSTSNNSTGGTNNKSRTKLSTPNLFSSANGGSASSGNLVDENFNVFDSALDEQAFVSALLESNENAALSVLN